MPFCHFKRSFPAFATLIGASALALSLAPASAAKRCDWHGPLSGGESQYNKCVDFATLNGTTLQVPKNVTRISADGISICQPKTPTTGAGNADIVFIYDNSGSMTADAAYINAATKDTSFYYIDNNSQCSENLITPTQNLTYPSRDGGTWTVRLLSGNSGCAGAVAGDPYNARGAVIKAGIDFLASTSPTSTAGAISFNTEIKYLQAPVQMTSAANANQVKNSIKLDTDGGTHYKPPLEKAKDWLTDASLTKTSKQAIIFISDGAPKDAADGANGYLSLVDDDMPPIFSIYMSNDVTKDTANLQQLSELTGGSFTRVAGSDPKAMEALLKSIITTITTNTLPRGVTVTNKSLSPPQTSASVAVVGNPDGSAGMRLDSIIALKEGPNQIDLKLTKEDNTSATYSFTMNVAAAEISATGGNYSCWDMPTLTAVDKKTGLTPEIYRPDNTSYQLTLTRSPSDLKTTGVEGSSANGDKESISLPTLNTSRVYPSHTGDFTYNPAKSNGTDGNGILEVDGKGDLTFVWSHPRDERETVTYILPGRVIPVISGAVTLTIKDPVTKGVTFEPTKGHSSNPVVVTDGKGKCLVNCSGTEDFHTSTGVPTWVLVVKSPIKYTVNVFDNLGQFISASDGEMDEAAWAAVVKSGDSATINLKILPVSESGQQLGTGAYVMRAEITALGSLVTTGSSGESIVVKNHKREYTKRFGYVR